MSEAKKFTLEALADSVGWMVANHGDNITNYAMPVIEAVKAEQATFSQCWNKAFNASLDDEAAEVAFWHAAGKAAAGLCARAAHTSAVIDGVRVVEDEELRRSWAANSRLAEPLMLQAEARLSELRKGDLASEIAGDRLLATTGSEEAVRFQQDAWDARKRWLIEERMKRRAAQGDPSLGAALRRT